MEKSPKEFNQKIKTEIFNFLRNYKKIRFNMQKTILLIKEGVLAILDLEMQCQVLHCTLIKKLIRDSIEEIYGPKKKYEQIS